MLLPSSGHQERCFSANNIQISTMSNIRHHILFSFTVQSIFCESKTFPLPLTKEHRLGAFKDSNAEKKFESKERQEAENKIKPNERGLSGEGL
jgi:hypothetical protein